MRIRLMAVLLLAARPVLAQPKTPPTEHVTVTGTKARAVTDAFVQAFAVPSRMTGKLARWEDGVCPLTVGLKPKFTDFISRRVREVAAQAGAPVNRRASCAPNIEIVFTTAPQALLDDVRTRHQIFLGYHDYSGQADVLAKVSRPIQAWYTTATKDLRGKTRIDSPGAQGTGEPSNIPGDTSNMIFGSSAVTGSRIDDGMRSAFYHVIVAADPNRLLDLEIGSLADYIAMLALTQPASLDTCQQLPSIVNLLAKGCGAPVTALTDNDLGYLKGLYRMRASARLGVQQDEISYQMRQGPEDK